MTPLEKFAGEAALVAPLHRNKCATHTLIDWRLIDDIRAELLRQGIDWRKARADMLRRARLAKSQER